MIRKKRNGIIICIVLWLLAIYLQGCPGLQLTNSGTNKAIAYAAGKGFAIGINSTIPELDRALTQEWVSLMDRHNSVGIEAISPSEIIGFYNSCLIIISQHYEDPYGLIGDLSTFLLIFNGEFNNQKSLIKIDPIPVETMDFFGFGYANGRALYNPRRKK